MVLKSELTPGKKVAFYYNQISWIKNLDGSVHQVWEIYDNKKADRLLLMYKNNEMEMRSVYEKKYAADVLLKLERK